MIIFIFCYQKTTFVVVDVKFSYFFGSSCTLDFPIFNNLKVWKLQLLIMNKYPRKPLLPHRYKKVLGLMLVRCIQIMLELKIAAQQRCCSFRDGSMQWNVFVSQ